MMTLSVILPAFNASKVIGRQLDVLARQSADRAHGWEIIVADNGSADDTVAAAEAFSDRLPLRIVDASARRGPSPARNLGVAAANGRVFVFTDADDLIAEGWLETWSRWAHRATVDALAAGPVLIGSAPDLPRDDALSCRPPEHMGLPYASSNNLGIHRQLFERLGGFDEQRRTGEDADLSWRALRLGAEIECVPARLQVAHDRRGRTLLRRYYEYGLGDPSLFRDHHHVGARREPTWRLVRTYGGLVARLPLLHDTDQRERWLRQAGRRAGRLVGSVRARTWLP